MELRGWSVGIPMTTTDAPRAAAARAILGRVTYPDSLPISERHDELLTAIRDH